MFATLLTCCLLAAPAPSGHEAYNFAVSLARRGPRPAASAAERKAHQRVAARFRAVGLRVGYERFSVPGKGPSRDVIGMRDSPAECLVIAMAHTDSVPPAPGADDNASGVGTLVALARSLATDPEPECDVWLVATGSEERPYTGTPNHLGASALASRLQKTKRLKDVKLALSLDEVGRGRKFDLHSTATRIGPLERTLLDAGATRWVQDPRGEGNSDHR